MRDGMSSDNARVWRILAHPPPHPAMHGMVCCVVCATCVPCCRHHAGGVHTLATGVDTGRVFSGSNDFTCVMWSSKGGFMKLYAGHSNGVRCTLGTCASRLHHTVAVVVVGCLHASPALPSCRDATFTRVHVPRCLHGCCGACVGANCCSVNEHLQRWGPCCGPERTTTPSVCGTRTSAPAVQCSRDTLTLCWA